MLKILERRYICSSCTASLARQVRSASKLSSINRGLFRENNGQRESPRRAGSRQNDERQGYSKYPVRSPRPAANTTSPGESASPSWHGRAPVDYGQQSRNKTSKSPRDLSKLARRNKEKVASLEQRVSSQASVSSGLRFGGDDSLAAVRADIEELNLRIKKLGNWFENDIPPILEPKEGFGLADSADFRRKIEEYWLRFFQEKPGRMGAITTLYAKTLKDIQSRLRSPPLRDSNEKWVTRKKMTYLGRSTDEELFPTRKKWIRLHINTAYQRSLTREKPGYSPWKKEKPLTIEEYAAQWDATLLKYGQTGSSDDEIVRLMSKMNAVEHTSGPFPEQDDLGFLSKAKHDAGTKGKLLRGRDWLLDNLAAWSSKEVEAKYPTKPPREAPTLPLTTAASTWIYGKSAAIACLKSGHRKIYKAYLSGQLKDEDEASGLRDLLRQQGCQTIIVKGQDMIKAMFLVCDGRPHQGVLLEVSPLPFPPVTCMRSVSKMGEKRVAFDVEPQQIEELEINKRLGHLKAHNTSGWRNPLVLLLDGVLDEGNMGNIIRTAYFYGVDAVAICVNTCAPISSPIVAKAASGALEAMPLLRLNKPSDFLRLSQINKWKVWASVPPGNDSLAVKRPRTKVTTILGTSNMRSPLADAPAILMLGSEGEGLRDIMLARADGRVSIDPPGGNERRHDLGIDSMNVASAAAVLLEAFMRKPEGWTSKTEGQRTETLPPSPSQIDEPVVQVS